jgi:hypothetical protein
MSMPIYIPSMGRAGALFNSISTLSFMKKLDNPIHLVVPPDEAGRYRSALLNHSRDDVIVLECPEKGIAKTRHWIGKLCLKKNTPKFVMMDDDLNFAVRIDETSYKLRPQEHKDTVEMVNWIETALSKYAHVSVAPRDASAGERVKSGAKPLTLENKRTLRLLAYRTAEFMSVKHGRVDVMEDFDVNLQLLERGLPNLLAYWWTNDQRQTGSPGGCSIYRSKEVHEASARRLAELHEFVTLRQKKNTGQVVKAARDMQDRLEVTIYWEKTFAASQRAAR